MNLHHMPEETILNLRLSDIAKLPTPKWVTKLMLQINAELLAQGITFKPHYWFATEWFCPDGFAGMALPHYLLHPRLAQLEKKYTGFIEGNNEKEFLLLARHELGHILDNVFKLRRLKVRAQIFGPISTPYPRSYTAVPGDRNFVKNLQGDYAQAHPEEDWAETFAVWLNPKSQWRDKYRKWPAIEKLEYLDSVMTKIKRTVPPSPNRKTFENIRHDHRTLREYYREKQKERKINRRRFFTPVLLKKFKLSHGTDLSHVIQVHQKQILQKVAAHTNQSHYHILPMIKLLKKEAKGHHLSPTAQEDRVLKAVATILIQEQVRFRKQGRHRIMM